MLTLAVAAAGAVGSLASRGAGVPPAPCERPARRDGLLVCDGQGAPARARAWLAGRKLDVNEASQLDLEAIPGVGPSLARAIVQARGAGRFASLDELDAVPGIGAKTLARLTRFIELR